MWPVNTVMSCNRDFFGEGDLSTVSDIRVDGLS